MGRPKMSEAEKAAAKAKREAGKKPRAAKSTEATTAEAPEPRAASSQSSEFKKPAPAELLKLVKQVCSRAADQKTIGMAAKELIDKAAETRGLNPRAFGMVRTLWKMGQDNPEKLAVTLPHLLSYIDDLDLASIADDARGLPINGEDDEGDEDDGQIDTEEAIAETTGAETSLADAMGEAIASDTAEWPDDKHVARSRLSIVPGPNAPPAEDESNAA